MSIMLAMAACGGRTLPAQAGFGGGNQSIVLPAGVSSLAYVTGNGGNGTPETTQYVQSYTEQVTSYNQQNSQGGVVRTRDQGTTTKLGPKPENYCTEHTGIRINGIVDYVWLCYTYADTSGMVTTPATNGADTTAFGLTFPGGVGGPAKSTTFENVAVTPGGTYPAVMPNTGNIVISYYP